MGLTTLPSSCTDWPAIREPQTPGTLRACPGLFRDFFRFTVYCGASCSRVSCHPMGVMLSTGA